MKETDAIAIFKCLADRSRLQILKSLAREDMYVELLAQRLSLTPATVSFHLKKLTEAGAVSGYKSQYYMMYTLNRELFQVSVLSLLLEESDEADIQQKREEAYRQKVIDSFMEYGRLKSIPVQRKKKRIILELIAEKLETGRVYSEREINDLILTFHEDYCTLRRDLISEKFLARDSDRYWKVVEEC